MLNSLGIHSTFTLPTFFRLKGSKDLVNQDLLSPIRKCAGQSRTEIIKYSLSFPINSVYLISKEALSMIDEKLQEYKQQFWDKV